MFSARDIAAKLGQFEPTAEQEAIIEADPTGTYRVIAGAGSGKTETMAQRVLWLVANGHVQPGEVLGLTFTRKAAGELGRQAGVWVEHRVDAVHTDVLGPELSRQRLAGDDHRALGAVVPGQAGARANASCASPRSNHQATTNAGKAAAT